MGWINASLPTHQSNQLRLSVWCHLGFQMQHRPLSGCSICLISHSNCWEIAGFPKPQRYSQHVFIHSRETEGISCNLEGLVESGNPWVDTWCQSMDVSLLKWAQEQGRWWWFEAKSRLCSFIQALGPPGRWGGRKRCLAWKMTAIFRSEPAAPLARTQSVSAEPGQQNASAWEQLAPMKHQLCTHWKTVGELSKTKHRWALWLCGASF